MTAYYSENNPYAAAWLRQLIANGLIPAGRVDARSIADVDPEDLRPYTQHHLFAGIGGWPLAARLAGWPDDRPLFTGSAPCQPFSVAGKGLGAADPRHLWPHMFRLIRALRPTVIMGEQVAGTAGYGWLDGVHADLEAEDYTCEAVDIPAGSVNAPHIRNRIYWMAHPASVAQREPQHPLCPEPWNNPRPDAGGSDSRPIGLDDSAGPRCLTAGPGEVEALRDRAWSGQPERRSGDGESVGLADSRSGLLPLPLGRQERRDGPRPAGALLGWLADPTDGGRRILRQSSREGGLPHWSHADLGMGDADLDVPSDGLLQRSRQLGGLGLDPQGHPGFWDEWTLVGPDPSGKYRRVKPGVRLLAHGIPSRVAKLRAFGNAIVPALAAEVIRAYMETHLA